MNAVEHQEQRAECLSVGPQNERLGLSSGRYQSFVFVGRTQSPLSVRFQVRLDYQPLFGKGTRAPLCSILVRT